ncbi:MAG: signal peptidase I [Pyrinomonadaceae bacterium]
MFDFTRKKQHAFGIVATDDDHDIEIQKIKRDAQNGLWSEGAKLARDIIFVLAAFVLLCVFVAQPVVVEGTSMLPNLRDGERLIVDKLVYYKWQNSSWGHLERGDIVVFWYPNDPDKSYVKRIIGLPGETVEMRNGVVYINGAEMRENYLDAEHNQNKENFRPHKVSEHYYFVMGDNRDNSSDSRIWGLVPEKYIYGKVFFRYWEPSRFGFISKGNYELNEQKSKSEPAATMDLDEQ